MYRVQPVAPHDACLAYLEHVADRFDLRRDIRFGTRVERTVFDEDGGRWAVRTAAVTKWSRRSS